MNFSAIDGVIECQSQLYKEHKPRNFLFINVPPRCVSADGEIAPLHIPRIDTVLKVKCLPRRSRITIR